MEDNNTKFSKLRNWSVALKPKTSVNKNNTINITISAQDAEKLLDLITDIKTILLEKTNG